MILLERMKMPSLFYGRLSKGKPVITDVFTNAGRKEMPNYGWTINENGEEVLAVKSYTNIQEKINSVHDTVALPLLIKRFMEGDETALSGNKASAFYEDITALPSNMHEAHRIMVEMRDSFDSMPYEDRAFFNNDFNQFIASAGDGNFLAFLEKKYKQDLDGDGLVDGKPAYKRVEDNKDVVKDVVKDVISDIKKAGDINE